MLCVGPRVSSKVRKRKENLHDVPEGRIHAKVTRGGVLLQLFDV